MTYHPGFGLGGTFPDLTLVASSTGRIESFKVLTTPASRQAGALTGICDSVRQQGNSGIAHGLP